MAPTSRAPRRGDVILGGVVTAIALGLLGLLPVLADLDPEVAVTLPSPSDPVWWAAVVAVVGQGALLTRLSTAPERVLVAVAAIALGMSLVPLGEASSIAFVAVVPAAYVATRQRSSAAPWTSWYLATALSAGAGAVVNVRLDDADVLLSLVAAAGQALTVVGLPALVGWVAAARVESRTARERATVARAHELEARAEAAVAAERTAIARELHDIAAHHLSGIALMSSAISQQIDTDPTTAKAGLADVRGQTRELLDELRGLVALLRHDEGAPVDVESLAGLETLVPHARDRGLDVSLVTPQGVTVHELSRGIGPLGQFAAYKTVREALANAARHAPDSWCTVELRDAGGALAITVTNGPGSPAPPREADEGGFGLRGMQERAALTRSTLGYGATESGGWRVVLQVPREPGHDTARRGELS
ncbi:sensor histidine kinase [Aeromicrobium sp. CF4.19]|uniref:sensor histidine kinase n=1 Tax=Aeromicrobium sp. CF4.19 TaxID=3373082 RepID=UPI003EE60EE1